MGGKSRMRAGPRRSETVRRAAAEDASRLAEVHILSWQHAYRGQFPDGFLDGLDLEARRRFFDRVISEGAVILVSESGHDLAGFCFVGAADAEGWGEIYAIYVHPDRWGEGHGRRLIVAAEDELRALGHHKALLWVLETNHRARSFYERQGWTLAKPVRIEEIGGVQVTEVRYERDLLDGP